MKKTLLYTTRMICILPILIASGRVFGEPNFPIGKWQSLQKAVSDFCKEKAKVKCDILTIQELRGGITDLIDKISTKDKWPDKLDGLRSMVQIQSDFLVWKESGDLLKIENIYVRLKELSQKFPTANDENNLRQLFLMEEMAVGTQKIAKEKLEEVLSELCKVTANENQWCDLDGDKIINKEDTCPRAPGIAMFYGCTEKLWVDLHPPIIPPATSGGTAEVPTVKDITIEINKADKEEELKPKEEPKRKEELKIEHVAIMNPPLVAKSADPKLEKIEVHLPQKLYQDPPATQVLDAESLQIELHPEWIELGQFESGEYVASDPKAILEELKALRDVLKKGSIKVVRVELVGTADADQPASCSYDGRYRDSLGKGYDYIFSGEVRRAKTIDMVQGKILSNVQLAALRAFFVWFELMNKDAFWRQYSNVVSIVSETSGELGSHYRRVVMRLITDKPIPTKDKDSVRTQITILKF